MYVSFTSSFLPFFFEKHHSTGKRPLMTTILRWNKKKSINQFSNILPDCDYLSLNNYRFMTTILLGYPSCSINCSFSPIFLNSLVKRLKKLDFIQIEISNKILQQKFFKNKIDSNMRHNSTSESHWMISRWYCNSIAVSLMCPLFSKHFPLRFFCLHLGPHSFF